jgi:hypothetical protein
LYLDAEILSYEALVYTLVDSYVNGRYLEAKINVEFTRGDHDYAALGGRTARGGAEDNGPGPC